MTDLLAEVRSRLPADCFVTRCQKEQCTVKLAHAPQPYAVIDMDCRAIQSKSNAKRCDYLFVSNENYWIVPMELKSGQPNASDLVNQLQAGADYVNSIAPRNISIRLVPVAVVGGKLRKPVREAVKRNRIKFRRKNLQIQLLRCGSPLTKILKGSKS